MAHAHLAQQLKTSRQSLGGDIGVRAVNRRHPMQCYGAAPCGTMIRLDELLGANDWDALAEINLTRGHQRPISQGFNPVRHRLA